MYIVMFSINPLFPDVVMGGAPKHLQNIAIAMGERGHEITVLCTQGKDGNLPFKWHEKVEVQPILPFHQPFPQPYAVPAYDLATIVHVIGDYLEKADRFYMHDGELLFPYVYQHIPTIVSLRDNVYPETLIGSFLFRGDKLILISEYSRQYFLNTVGRFFPDLDDRIEVIHNGLDWQKFKPVQPQKILNIIPIDPDAQPIVLHPHRPEESKGIRQTIAVVDLLVHQYGFDNLIALAPRWHEVQISSDLREFYDSIRREISERNLQNNFIFHEWVPQDLMPEYFSLGDVTLSLGNFVESFGNSVYESMGCGTPSIVSRISTHRELLPDHLIDKVDYDDIEGAASIAARILHHRETPRPEALEYLHSYYSVDRQLQAYADVILGAQQCPALQYRHQSIDEQTQFHLPPWCYRSSRGIYHDFHAGYRQLTDIEALLIECPDGFTYADGRQHGVSAEVINHWYHEGYLVPTTG